MAHAFLFTGARGVGKTSAARVLARALNCEQGPTPTPCGSCPRCEEITAGTAVDVLEIDAASNRGIDDIRVLRESVRYLPSVARRKVIIVDEVHMLTTEAFNALLKTLEEPPPHVVFVLATTDPHKVPVTILSRCQRYDFKRVGLSRLVEHLGAILQKEGLKVARAGLVLLAREAEGSVRDALSLLDQVLSYAGARPGSEVSEQSVADVLGVADRALVSRLGRALCQRNLVDTLSIVEEGFGRGYDMAELGRSLLGHLRDLLVVKLLPDPAALVERSDEELAEARALVASVDAGLFEQHFHFLSRALDDVARSPDPRASLEMALVRIARAEPLMPLGEILERLEALERGAPASAGGPAGTPPSRGLPSTARAQVAGGSSPGAPVVKAAAAPMVSSAEADPPARAAAPLPALPAAETASPAAAGKVRPESGVEVRPANGAGASAAPEAGPPPSG